MEGPYSLLKAESPYLPESSADNLCKQFGPRSGPTLCRAWSGSKLFDTLIFDPNYLTPWYSWKNFSKKLIWKKNQQTTNSMKIPQYAKLWNFIMPPTLERLRRHIALGLSLSPSMCLLQNLLRYRFEISYMDSSSKNYRHYLPLWSYAPIKGHNEIL